jgi:hypothetical protein
MRSRTVVLILFVTITVVAGAEIAMGRLWLGPDGRFAWWEGNIWSSEQSQRFADPYSITHIVHGLIYYFGLWLVARRASTTTRFATALAIEGAWEILENSPIIIDRYREVTISLGYVGDSVLNSASDILMMAIGFGIAATWPVLVSVAFVATTEIALAWMVRDNLTLNLIMLIHPVDAIRAWQMAGAPH